MYDALARQDFFGTHGRDLGEYGFADRLNLSFKIGALAEVPFSEEEEELRGRVLKAETFEDILELSRELGKMAKEEAETNMEDMEMSEFGDETESNEDEDVEPSGSAPFPMPTPPESEENEEEEDSGARADSDEEKEDIDHMTTAQLKVYGKNVAKRRSRHPLSKILLFVYLSKFLTTI